MKFLGTQKIFSALNVGASGFVDFETNAGGAGVSIYVVTSNPQAGPTFTFSIGALNPDGSELTLITSPAVIAALTTRVAVLPGVTAQANIIAAEVIPGTGRFRYIHGAGSFNIDVWMASFG